tara:strand:- start:302 stop:610 length:309 start_codon:yes stop_codon:yes gene_type:complete
MIIKNKSKIDSSNVSESYDERVKKLQLIIDQFEDVALRYGPESSKELKNRIDKIIKRFDREFRAILDNRSEQFWNNKASNKKSDLGELKDAKVPKFLKNYKK